MKKKKKNNPLLIVLFCIFAGVFVFAAVMIGKTLLGYAQIAETQKEIRSIFFDDESSASGSSVPKNTKDKKTYEEDSTTPEDPWADYDFDALLKINPDVVGWMSIPWIGVSHPVVQCDDNDTYLYTNLFGEVENGGTFFLDYRTVPGEAENLILYGHSMYDGSMFGQLRKYFDQSFADEHPYFWYYTPGQIYRCDIISTYLTTTSDPYIVMDFVSYEDKLAYVERMRNKSCVTFPEVEVGEADVLLTISTCNYSQVKEDGRQPMLVKLTPYSLEDEESMDESSVTSGE